MYSISYSLERTLCKVSSEGGSKSYRTHGCDKQSRRSRGRKLETKPAVCQLPINFKDDEGMKFVTIYFFDCRSCFFFFLYFFLSPSSWLVMWFKCSRCQKLFWCLSSPVQRINPSEPLVGVFCAPVTFSFAVCSFSLLYRGSWKQHNRS